MARGIHRLTALQVAKAMRRGLTLNDGGNLYLQRGRSWVFRYARHGKTHWLGLGPIDLVDLQAARAAALANRKLLFEGVDPMARRHAERARVAMTFAAAAWAYIAAHRDTWRNPRHAAQWTMTLDTYCAGLHHLPVQEVDTAAVLRTLEPIWREKPETASRLRGRIESVLGWATACGHRSGENPARWKAHLDQLLPGRGKVRAVKHHAALPHAEVPAFVASLRRQDSVAARALELVILCAVRTGDVVGQNRDDAPPLKWSHLDLERRLWSIPRTKSGVAHRVPLSDSAMAVLDRMRPLRDDSDVVFHGKKRGEALSPSAMLTMLRRAEQGLTVHGFRSAFKTWASEETAFDHAVVEACLTHVISSALERAYRRSDFLEKRARLMAAWGAFCEGRTVSDVVVPLRA